MKITNILTVGQRWYAEKTDTTLLITCVTDDEFSYTHVETGKEYTELRFEAETLTKYFKLLEDK